MQKVYRIKDWQVHFENNKSRERDLCSWCPMPNKQDGLGYGRLVAMKDGAALYGAFVAVVLVASKQRKPRDGHLTDTGRADGCPLTAEDLAIMSKLPSAVIQRMLDATSCASIGWVEVYDTGHTSASEVPAKCPPGVLLKKEGKEGNEGKEENGGTPQKKYGEFGNVILAPAEHAKLLHEHGAARLAKGIDILDAYIAQSGKRYKSHYAVLKPSGWVWDRVGQGGALPAQGATPQNRLMAPFQRVQAAPEPPKMYSDEELDRMIAADEARKAGAK